MNKISPRLPIGVTSKVISDPCVSGQQFFFIRFTFLKLIVNFDILSTIKCLQIGIGLAAYLLLDPDEFIRVAIILWVNVLELQLWLSEGALPTIGRVVDPRGGRSSTN